MQDARDLLQALEVPAFIDFEGRTHEGKVPSIFDHEAAITEYLESFKQSDEASRRARLDQAFQRLGFEEESRSVLLKMPAAVLHALVKGFFDGLNRREPMTPAVMTEKPALTVTR